MSRGIFVNNKEAKKGDLILPWICSLIGVCILFAAQFAGLFGLMIAGLDYNKYEGTYLFAYAVVALIALPFFCKLCKKLYSDNNSGISIKKPLFIDVFIIFALAIGMIGMVNLYILIVTWIGEHMQNVQEQLEQYSESMDRYTEISVDEVPAFDKILDYIASAVMIPVVEEILFRGIIVGQFRKAYRPWVAISVSAIVFGLVHGLSVHIGYALLCGVIIGLVYYLTSNLVLTSIIHMCFNFFGAVLPEIIRNGAFTTDPEQIEGILSFMVSVELYMMPAVFVGIAIFALKLRNSSGVKEQINASDLAALNGTREAKINEDIVGGEDKNKIEIVIK